MTSNAAPPQTEITTANYNHWTTVTLKGLVLFKFNGHGNAAAHNTILPPPQHPGPRPHIDDMYINQNNMKPSGRRLYTFQPPSDEEIAAAEEKTVKLDPYDFGLTPASTTDLNQAQRAYDITAKECRNLCAEYNKNDMLTTNLLFSALAPRTLSKIKLHAQYDSLTVAPADLKTTCTTSTLLTIIKDIFSVGNAADASAAFQTLLSYEYSPENGLAHNLSQIEQLSNNSLDRLTNADGLIDPKSIESLMIIQKIASIDPRQPWHARFLRDALTRPLDGDQPLPSPAELHSLAVSEEQLSATVDNNAIDDIVSEQGAGYMSTVQPPYKKLDPLKDRRQDPPKDITDGRPHREKTFTEPCWSCIKYDNGAIRHGHPPDICTNNPKSANYIKKNNNSTNNTNNNNNNNNNTNNNNNNNTNPKTSRYKKFNATGHLAATADDALATAATAADAASDVAYELAFLRGHYASTQESTSAASSVSGLP
jgi:hypothetical protein